MLRTKKIIKALQAKQKTKDNIHEKKSRNHSYVQDKHDRVTSTLFRYQKGLTVGTCHDINDLSYDNHLYIHVVKVSFCSQYSFVSILYNLLYYEEHFTVFTIGKE